MLAQYVCLVYLTDPKLTPNPSFAAAISGLSKFPLMMSGAGLNFGSLHSGLWGRGSVSARIDCPH
jgi:hypothetical protein